MITFWMAVILGIVEGLTEFLPVSSTGHMILTDYFFHIQEELLKEKIKIFEVVIQLGAILAVLWLYRAKVWQLLNWKVNGPWWQLRKDRLTVIHVLIAIFPAMFIGLLFHDVIKGVLFNAKSVLIALVVGALYMWFAEWYGTKRPPSAENMDQITYRQAIWIGFAQILSLWSGFSRSGSTMATGMLTGVSYRAAADFSFFIAIPMMVAASAYDLYQGIKDQIISLDDIPMFAVGFIVAFFVALLAVIYFLKWLSHIPLRYFAWYRIALAIVFALLMYFGDLNF